MSEKMSSGNTPRKPEWFELTDSSAPSAQVRKINKVLPSVAVLAAASIIGIGSIFANGAASNPIESLSITASTPTPTSATATRVVDSSVTTAVDVAPITDTAIGGTVQNPASVGVAPPRGGGDGDNEAGDDD